MNEFPKFWMILSDVPGATPVLRYNSEFNAKFEAAQFANKNPGTKFYVLECIAAVAKAEVQWSEAKDLPF